MKFYIIQTNIRENEQRVIFATHDRDIMETMLRDYEKNSDSWYTYQAIEKTTEN